MLVLLPPPKSKNIFQILGDRFKNAGQGNRLRTAKTDSNSGKAHSIKNILKRKKASSGSKYKLLNFSDADIERFAKNVNEVLKGHPSGGKGYLTRNNIIELNRKDREDLGKGIISKADILDNKELYKSMKKKRMGNWENTFNSAAGGTAVQNNNVSEQDNSDSPRTNKMSPLFHDLNLNNSTKISNIPEFKHQPENDLNNQDDKKDEDYVKNKGEDQREEEQKLEDEIEDMVI